MPYDQKTWDAFTRVISPKWPPGKTGDGALDAFLRQMQREEERAQSHVVDFLSRVPKLSEMSHLASLGPTSREKKLNDLVSLAGINKMQAAMERLPNPESAIQNLQAGLKKVQDVRREKGWDAATTELRDLLSQTGELGKVLGRPYELFDFEQIERAMNMARSKFFPPATPFKETTLTNPIQPLPTTPETTDRQNAQETLLYAVSSPARSNLARCRTPRKRARGKICLSR